MVQVSVIAGAFGFTLSGTFCFTFLESFSGVDWGEQPCGNAV
jgi:hypothetical protein